MCISVNPPVIKNEWLSFYIWLIKNLILSLSFFIDDVLFYKFFRTSESLNVYQNM